MSEEILSWHLYCIYHHHILHPFELALAFCDISLIIGKIHIKRTLGLTLHLGITSEECLRLVKSIVKHGQTP